MSIDAGNGKNSKHRSRYAVEARRKEVAKLYALGETETEIADGLGISQQTISTDLKALKEMSRQFVFDLAKSDLATYYKQSIDAVEYALNKSYKLVKAGLVPKYELLALRLIKDCAEAKFNLLERGPLIMNARTLEDRLTKIENGNANGNGNGKHQDRLFNSLTARADALVVTDNGNTNNEDSDHDYYLGLGYEPPRFAQYRLARARHKNAFGDKTYEDVWDSITQDELDYYLKLRLRESPEQRYQRVKKEPWTHETGWSTRGLNGYDGYGCNHFTGCIPECRYYPAYGRIEDEEVIADHNECVESYKQRWNIETNKSSI